MPVLPNRKHEAFAQAMAKGKPQAEAYVLAGYKASEPHASRLASDGKVQARMAELAEKSAVRAEIDISQVLRELACIGMADLREAFNANGSIKDPAEWSDELAAAISSVEFADGKVAKVRLWDKNAALDKIAKHFGMFIERQEVTVTHRFSDLSDQELKFELTALVGRNRQQAAKH